MGWGVHDFKLGVWAEIFFKLGLEGGREFNSLGWRGRGTLLGNHSCFILGLVSIHLLLNIVITEVFFKFNSPITYEIQTINRKDDYRIPQTGYTCPKYRRSEAFSSHTPSL